MVREEILKLAEECSIPHSAHVVDVAIRGSNKRSFVEVFVDAESGITTEMCATISRALGERLDTSGEMQGSYELIVSSPGIDRPLKFPWQYKKHLQRTLAVKFKSGPDLEDRTGKLLDVNDDGVTLQAGKDAARISFSAIQEAIVKSPW